MAGAVAPFAGTTLTGAAAIGATANTAQYLMTNTSNNKAITAREVVANAVFGAVGGGLGGKLLSKNPSSQNIESLY